MRKFTLLASAAAVTAVVLSGCGNQPADQNNGQNGNNSTGDTGVGTLSLLAENMAKKSAEKSSAHMVFRAEAAGMSIAGEGDVKLGTEPAMQMAVNLGSEGSLEMRLVDEVIYVKLPQGLEPGKPWLRIDANGNDPISQSLGAALEQMKQSGDPSQLLTQLKDSGEITAQKQEELNGKQTTHYSVTVDVAKAAATTGAQQELVEEARKAGVEKLPIEVWVDQEQLPVRFTMEVPVKDPSSQQSSTVKVNVDYTDWGKPVTVAAPPAAEVAEIPR